MQYILGFLAEKKQNKNNKKTQQQLKKNIKKNALF